MASRSRMLSWLRRDLCVPAVSRLWPLYRLEDGVRFFKLNGTNDRTTPTYPAVRTGVMTGARTRVSSTNDPPPYGKKARFFGFRADVTGKIPIVLYDVAITEGGHIYTVYLEEERTAAPFLLAICS